MGGPDARHDPGPGARGPLQRDSGRGPSPGARGAGRRRGEPARGGAQARGARRARRRASRRPDDDSLPQVAPARQRRVRPGRPARYRGW